MEELIKESVSLEEELNALKSDSVSKMMIKMNFEHFVQFVKFATG